jgi:hypothetical protein
MNPLKLWSVNWKDGMLISQRHLREEEGYHEELVQWLSSNGLGGYGLVSNPAYRNQALQVTPLLKGNQLIVTIDSCQAITSNGSIIQINRENQDTSPVSATMDVDPESEQKIALYLIVDSGEKKEVGTPHSNEEPPRLPFSTFRYSLHMGTPPNSPEGSWLQIAELTLGRNQVALNDGYIPPCLSVSSSEALYNTTQGFRNTLEKMLSLTTQTFKGFSSARAMDQYSEDIPIRQSILDISHNLSIFLSTTLDVQPPIGILHPADLVLHYKNLFRLFHTLFELHPTARSFIKRGPKSEMEESFFSNLKAFLGSPYHHDNLQSHTSTIRQILQGMEELLLYIAELSPERLIDIAGILSYRDKSYRLLDFETCKFRPVDDLHHLTLENIKGGTIQDILVLIRRELFARDEYQFLDVRIGVNEANTLGQSDPGEVDPFTVPDRIVFSFIDRLRASDVNKLNVIFRGPINYSRLTNITRGDVQVYGL